MTGLHLTKVAFGCTGLDILIDRMAAHQNMDAVRLTTRNAPKRLDELSGGSLYWIIRHQLVARSSILRFERDEAIDKWHIVIDPALVLVHPAPMRAHQGWRYLEASGAPADLGPVGHDGASLPPGLMQELADLALI